MFKKILIIGLSLIIGVGCLVGCGSSKMTEEERMEQTLEVMDLFNISIESETLRLNISVQIAEGKVSFDDQDIVLLYNRTCTLIESFNKNILSYDLEEIFGKEKGELYKTYSENSLKICEYAKEQSEQKDIFVNSSVLMQLGNDTQKIAEKIAE